MTTEFTVGELVYYVLPPNPKAGRAGMVYLPAVIVNIAAKRIVIRVEGQRRSRNVLPISLARKRP